MKVFWGFVIAALVSIGVYEALSQQEATPVKTDINAVMLSIQKAGQEACDKIDGILVGGIETQVDVLTGDTTIGGGYYCFPKNLFKGRSI